MMKILRKCSSLEIPYILLGLFLPFSYTILWLSLNTQLPGNDAANYLMTSVNIFHHFSEHGFWSGIQSVYLERGWRPIFFPVLAVPFLLISHGNLYFSYFLVALLSLVFSGIYIYLFFRLKLDRFPAIIATNLIILLPFVQAQVVMFYAEAALLPCLIGCIYHLIKSDYLRDKKHVYGFIALFALAFTMRPVEAATHLIFVLTAFLYLGWRSNYFNLKQIMSVLFICLSALFLMLFLAALPYIHFVPVQVIDGGVLDIRMTKVIHHALIASGISVFLIGFFIVFSPIKQIAYTFFASFYSNIRKTFLIPAFFASLLLVLIWFLPFAIETFQWVYRTSLGDVASSTGSLSGSHFSWNVLQIYLRNEGVLPVIGIVLITVLALVCLSNRQKRAVILSTPFIYLLLLLPFPIWEAFYTVQIVTRKLSVAVPALLMALLMLALQRGNQLFLRIMGITVVLFAVFGLSIGLMLSPETPDPIPFLNKTIGYFVPKPIRLKPNPHDVVIDFLAVQAAKYHLTSIALELNPGTPDARHPIEAEPVDPFLISTMAVASKQLYSVAYPYVSLYAPDTIQSFTDKYDGIFLSDLTSKMRISKEAAANYLQQYQVENSASLKVLYEFLFYYSNNTIQNKGWVVGPCINLEGERGGDYLGCLLLHKKVLS